MSEEQGAYQTGRLSGGRVTSEPQQALKQLERKAAKADELANILYQVLEAILDESPNKLQNRAWNLWAEYHEEFQL